jgi:hypothetical protein
MKKKEAKLKNSYAIIILALLVEVVVAFYAISSVDTESKNNKGVLIAPNR